MTYSIGTKFLSVNGKIKRLCTITDIWKTYDAATNLVKLRYVADHDGPLGGVITDYDISPVTVARGIDRLLP